MAFTSVLMLLCLLAATACAGFYDLNKWGSLSLRTGRPRLQVSVSPTEVDMQEGDTLLIKCRVKSARGLAEYPFIKFFYRYTPNSIMPLGYGVPGISVDTLPMTTGGEDDKSYVKAVSVLRLEPNAYYALRKGANHFYCRGSRLDGFAKRTSFTVNKV